MAYVRAVRPQPVPSHVYQADSDDPDTASCRRCPLPFDNRVHKVRQLTDEQRAAEARRTGDR